MMNFLLTISGALLLTKDDITTNQRTVAGVLLGVGLARSLDDILEN